MVSAAVPGSPLAAAWGCLQDRTKDAQHAVCVQVLLTHVCYVLGQRKTDRVLQDELSNRYEAEVSCISIGMMVEAS
jgi:hypothetical protein